jgi:hypothetical protein
MGARRGKRSVEGVPKKGLGPGGWLTVLLGTGGIGYLLVGVLDHVHDKRTVTVSTCTPNDTKNCECGNQNTRTCANDGLSWSRCNCDPVAVTSKISNTREEFCVMATAPPHAVMGCYKTSESCREQQHALSSQMDVDCIANPRSFACLTWKDDDGAYKMWCYASMGDCVGQGLGECAWVSREQSSDR